MCDGGDQPGPAGVGGDPVGELGAEHVGQRGSPVRAQGVVDAAGRCGGGGGGQVSREAPPERGGGLLVGQRAGVGNDAGQGRYVNAGAVCRGQLGGQDGPVGVAGQARVDGVGQRLPGRG